MEKSLQIFNDIFSPNYSLIKKLGWVNLKKKKDFFQFRLKIYLLKFCFVTPHLPRRL